MAGLVPADADSIPPAQPAPPPVSAIHDNGRGLDFDVCNQLDTQPEITPDDIALDTMGAGNSAGNSPADNDDLRDTETDSGALQYSRNGKKINVHLIYYDNGKHIREYVGCVPSSDMPDIANDNTRKHKAATRKPGFRRGPLP